MLIDFVKVFFNFASILCRSDAVGSLADKEESACGAIEGNRRLFKWRSIKFSPEKYFVLWAPSICNKEDKWILINKGGRGEMIFGNQQHNEIAQMNTWISRCSYNSEHLLNFTNISSAGLESFGFRGQYGYRAIICRPPLKYLLINITYA